MPFKTEQGKTVWTPPNKEDIVEISKKIHESGNSVNEVNTTVVSQLRERLDEAIAKFSHGKGWGIIASSNDQVYKTIEAITAAPRGLVDIIIPVHNSVHIVKQCIRAVAERTKWPYHMYLVDDASDSHTKVELEQLRRSMPNHITLITNKKNRGFAATVNRGIRESNGEFIVLLNSDVIVTPLWLTKMLMAHKANPRNQIICPATNNTAIVQIPLSPGASYLQMNRIFETFAIRQYPEIMPTGFCFLFPRNLLDKVGYFDETYKNFGEESDFWMRVLHYVDGDEYPRYRAVMADDTYVFHERGSSFSQLGSESHMELRKLASGRFRELWPQFGGWHKSYNVKKSLGYLREDIPAPLLVTSGDYQICWAVHSTAMCGGMRYIADIVNYINEKGGNARVALIKRTPESSTSCIGELRTAPIIFEGYEDFLSNFSSRVFRKGVVVAATAELAGAVQALHEQTSTIQTILHVQSYEPDMIPKASDEVKEKVKNAFKIIPNVISNSNWINDKLKYLDVTPFHTVSPGVDQDLFYPRGRDNGDERLTIMMSMIPTSPCKGFTRGVELIRELEKQAESRNIDLRILLYGVKQLPTINNTICLGELSQTRIAKILGTEVDLFVDPSSLHSYGMPSLEAVASKVAVASWDNKGVLEYLDSDKALIVPADTPPAKFASRILDLLVDTDKRQDLIDRAFEGLPFHNRIESVRDFTEALEKQLNLTITPRNIVVVVPHLRKHGGPTTMLHIANKLADNGHNVRIVTVYADVNLEVTATTELPISTDAQSLPKCDIVITNSDNPMCEAISKMPQIKKKIMLKLSHNSRFKTLEEQGLNCKWDAIVTSTDWLTKVCGNPDKDWNYAPVKATRIGWWHYGHEIMRRNPDSREYNDGSPQKPIVIGTLIHQHPSKGTQDAISAMGQIFTRCGVNVNFVGVGEVPPNRLRINLPNFKYKYAPNRQDMAQLLSSCDIWIGASHTEGLGRMSLEAMSAGTTCVISNTDAEFAQHGSNCLMFEPGDIDAIVQHVNNLIETPSLAADLRNNAFKTATKFADPDSCIDALEKVIKRLFK
ncbi:MAG: glycosyltransferase [Halobacteriota archaeon]|nr:glycosyltransferase [Halobacteriota archaeon]